jgi:hypothetical protein
MDRSRFQQEREFVNWSVGGTKEEERDKKIRGHGTRCWRTQNSDLQWPEVIL